MFGATRIGLAVDNGNLARVCPVWLECQCLRESCGSAASLTLLTLVILGTLLIDS